MLSIWLTAGLLLPVLAAVVAYRRGLFDGMMLRVAIALLAWLALGAAAFAASDTTISALPFYKAYVEPLLLVAIPAIVAGAFGWALTIAQSRVAILRSDLALKVEAQARDIVQTAATNAAGKIVAASEGPVSKIVVDVKSPIVASAVNSIADKVGPELRKLNVTPDQVQDTLSHLVVAKVGILQAGAPSTVTNPAQEAKAVPSATAGGL